MKLRTEKSYEEISEPFNGKWKTFITNIRDDSEYLLLSEETKKILENMTFASQGWDEYDGSGNPFKVRGVINCKSSKQNLCIFINKMDEKLVDFKFFAIDYCPTESPLKYIFSNDELNIIHHYMEMFGIIQMCNEVDDILKHG